MDACFITYTFPICWIEDLLDEGFNTTDDNIETFWKPIEAKTTFHQETM